MQIKFIDSEKNSLIIHTGSKHCYDLAAFSIKRWERLNSTVGIGSGFNLSDRLKIGGSIGTVQNAQTTVSQT